MDFQEHPGLLYVVATLLPLASFVILLLGGALRQFCRAHRENGLAASRYEMLGGDRPGRVAAHIATGAIGLASVLCAVGFVWHAVDHAHHEEHATATSGEHKHDHTAEPAHEEDTRWAGQITWARISPTGLPDADRGTIL